jgi:hypothetical protein
MANRFWVGGTGTWDTTSTANWSATSGGAAGASAPTSVDIAIFNPNSGGGTVTITENITILVFNPAGYTGGTINFNSNIISVEGNAQIVYNGNVQVTMTGNPRVELTYAGGTGTRTINGGIGVTEANAVSFNVVAGSDIVSMGGNGARLKDLTFQPAFTGSFTRASSGGLFGSLTMHSGMSFTATGNTLTFAATTPQTITTGGLTIDTALAFNGVGGVWSFQDAFTHGATRTMVFVNGTIRLKNGDTSTVGIFSTSGATQKFLESTVAGSQATLTQASGTVNVTNLTIKDINATGGATWNALLTSNNVDAGNNSGWFFGDPPITLATEYTYSIRSFTQPRRF